jgi:hypothetical protein
MYIYLGYFSEKYILEMIRTNAEITIFFIFSPSGLISFLFAWLMPLNINLLAGFIYAPLAIIPPLLGRPYERKEERYKASILSGVILGVFWAFSSVSYLKGIDPEADIMNMWLKKRGISISNAKILQK